MKSQNQEIFDYLKSGHSITASYAVQHFRCYRLAARIYDLRRLGHDIVVTTKKHKSKRTGRIVQYVAYSLGEA